MFAAIDITQIVRQFTGSLTPMDAVYPPGLLLFGTWLVRTSWGRKALAGSAPRRNDMPVYLPFVLLTGFFMAVPVLMSAVGRYAGGLEEWQKATLGDVIYCVAAGATVGVNVLLARMHFARQLKGYGLDIRTIARDIPAAFVNLLTVWPLVMVAITLTVYFGKLLWDPQYQMQQHEQLELMSKHSELPLRILVVLVAVVMAPAVEETLFRGMFQTTIRGFLGAYWAVGTDATKRSAGAWPSIIVTSGLFALVHADAGHWPALFILSICLGYAYEKSGSLFRAIFIHAMFNGATVAATLSQ